MFPPLQKLKKKLQLPESLSQSLRLMCCHLARDYSIGVAHRTMPQM